ncbi:hypothetical protein V5O48_017120, partial [Marasmius crinis-equi]
FEEVADVATTASLTAFPDVTPPKEVTSKLSTIDSNPILLTPIYPDPTLEASYAVFASGSNTISPESGSNSWSGDWRTGYSQQNTQPLLLPHGISPPFKDRPLHAAGPSAVVYTTPIHSHASHTGFDFSFRATYPNAYTGWNPNLPWSELPYSQSLPPHTVSLLEPSTAYSIPSFSYPNTSEALRGWNTTNTPSLKRKERDTLDLDTFLEGNTKRARLLETSESDAISRLWSAHDSAESSTSSDRLAGGARGTQPYERMSGPIAQTSVTEDENRRLRGENESMKWMLGISRSNGVV